MITIDMLQAARQLVLDQNAVVVLQELVQEIDHQLEDVDVNADRWALTNDELNRAYSL